MTRRPHRPAAESTLLVLNELVRGSRSAIELGANADLSPWTVRRALADLAGKGYVIKVPGIHHRAGDVGRWGAVWRITPDGRWHRKELRESRR